ncbi:MAG: hypothetical protein M1142_02025 [Patescibacteria group bacterium]|nr:hypothetical protein [Patescibacteria group bacterium]
MNKPWDCFSAKNKQKGLAPILIIILIAVAIIGGYLIYQKQFKSISSSQSSPIPAEIPFIATFNDCIKSVGSKVVESYPKQCESGEGKIYIEEIKDPIDISNWKEIDTHSGFLFKCPPEWQCKVSDDIHDAYIASAQIHNYINYFVGFVIVKAEDFQQSPFRHPSYKTGVAWLQALLSKDPKSIELMPGTYKVRPGTDGVSGPVYADHVTWSFDKMQEIEINNKKALIVGKRVFVPLNNQDLLYIDESLNQNNSLVVPLEKAIISSIKFNSPSKQ